MREHRRTKATVPNKAQPDTFHPTDALESLHAAILRVDTIIHMANEAVDRLHSPPTLLRDAPSRGCRSSWGKQRRKPAARSPMATS
jgi:hypothetical protein